MRQVLGGNALARIDDRQVDRASVGGGVQVDPATGRRVAQRIGHQVIDHLFEPIGVADDLIRGCRDVGGKGHVPRMRLVFVPSNDVLEQPLHGERAHLERSDAVLVPREIEQVFHDAVEPQRFTGDGVEIARPRRRVAVDAGHLQRFEISAHRRQRRFQLVRDVREHLTAETVERAHRLIARRELGGHAVERPRDMRDLVAAMLGRSRRQIAGAEPIGRRLERTQPPSGGSEDEHRRDRRHDDQHAGAPQ